MVPLVLVPVVLVLVPLTKRFGELSAETFR
jgi:hypothetical protein